MSLGHFQQLSAETKRSKLINAFNKIMTKYKSMKWIFTCCHNKYIVNEVYRDCLDMVTNVREFAKFLHDDCDEIDSKPACFNHRSSMYALDYLAADFERVIQIFITSLSEKLIYDHAKFSIMFELCLLVYDILKRFIKKYTSAIWDEH